MGAGYAAALSGQLCSALGSESDPTTREISSRVAELGIAHDPVRVFDHCADWTLLITSGEFGDKLPIGFRGCHAALEPDSLGSKAARPCDLRVVASLPNRLAARVLGRARCRHEVFRADNAKCRRPRISALGFCRVNRRPELQSPRVGEPGRPRGSCLASLDPGGHRWAHGELDSVHDTARGAWRSERPGVSAPSAAARHQPSRRVVRRDAALGPCSNMAGMPASGVIDDGLIQSAALRSAAAAALVLDRVDFGFPTGAEIEAALRAGSVA